MKYGREINDNEPHQDLFMPFENEWSEKLKSVKANCTMIVHADDCLCFEGYDSVRIGEWLQWRGVSWERGEKYNSMLRLHDPYNESRVVWANAGSLTPILEIEESEKFYGYIKSLQIIASDDVFRGMYVTFGYGGMVDGYYAACEDTIWKVPCVKLFKILSEKLLEDAWIIENTDDVGYQKLYIMKQGDEWKVNLP
jgi:hypothetical protein